MKRTGADEIYIPDVCLEKVVKNEWRTFTDNEFCRFSKRSLSPLSWIAPCNNF